MPVVAAALADPAYRLRKAAMDLVAALGSGGAAWREVLKRQATQEQEPGLRDLLAGLIERLEDDAGDNAFSPSATADPFSRNLAASPPTAGV